MLRKIILTSVFLMALGCAALAVADNHLIRLATTTSTDNSGLLREILPSFEAASGYKVHVIAVGTGKALRMGQDGDVDVVLVHARQAEEKFVEDGFGEKRHDVMYNDFVVVGPDSDPAGIRSSRDVTDAMRKIAKTNSIFISRGDDSGTHKKERQLWESSGSIPQGDWYREAGQGMGKVLQIAAELDAYTLADRGTWLAYRDKSSSELLFEGDGSLHNPYGIIAVSAARYPELNHQGAQALINWITSPQGQQLIGEFRINNSRLFVPTNVAPGQVAGKR